MTNALSSAIQPTAGSRLSLLAARSRALPFRAGMQMLGASALRIAHRAGWPALVGLMLVVASTVIVFTATQPTRDDIVTTEQQLKALRVTARSKTPEAVSPQTRLKDFYASFPARSALPDALMALHRVAQRNGLRDTRADYRDAPEAGTPLVRVRIDIPVTGSYAAIRSWIAQLLTDLPSLTLDGLELRRADIGKADLDARVRFQLLLRSAP
jgi:Tfp pilus assembly protein PilO